MIRDADDQVPTLRMAQIEIDHTALDLLVVENSYMPIDRAWLTITICNITQRILGFHLSPRSDHGGEV